MTDKPRIVPLYRRTGGAAPASPFGDPDDRGLADLGAAAAGARDRLRTVLAATERDLVELALRMAREVVGAEIAARPETVVPIAQAALATIGRRPPITVVACAADVALLSARAAELRDLAPGVDALGFRTDDALPRGSLRIETPAGLLDARVDTQFARLQAGLAGGPDVQSRR